MIKQEQVVADETTVTQESDSGLEEWQSPVYGPLADPSDSMEEMPAGPGRPVDTYQLTANNHESLFQPTGEEPVLSGSLICAFASPIQPRCRFTPHFPSLNSAQHSKELKLQQTRATAQLLERVKRFPPGDTGQILEKIVSLPVKFPGRKTLVLDLDETLVHCVSCEEGGDAKIAFSVQRHRVEAAVRVRPFAQTFLQLASELFEVVVFTASLSNYADRVLDLLDPTGDLIQHRLYRENCLLSEGYYVKDLRVLSDRKLRDMILVDNSVFSAVYQLENWVEVVSWHSDQGDTELLTLSRWLPKFAQALDVRPIVQEYVRSTSPALPTQSHSFVESFLHFF